MGQALQSPLPVGEVGPKVRVRGQTFHCLPGVCSLTPALSQRERELSSAIFRALLLIGQSVRNWPHPFRQTPMLPLPVGEVGPQVRVMGQTFLSHPGVCSLTPALSQRERELSSAIFRALLLIGQSVRNWPHPFRQTPMLPLPVGEVGPKVRVRGQTFHCLPGVCSLTPALSQWERGLSRATCRLRSSLKVGAGTDFIFFC